MLYQYQIHNIKIGVLYEIFSDNAQNIICIPTNKNIAYT